MTQELGSLVGATIRDFECMRGRSKKWYSRYFASNAEILEALGPEPMEPDDLDKIKVLKVPLYEGKWLDASVGTIMKSLKAHPDTKHLDAEAMTRVACSMIYRFGSPMPESVETEYESSVDFTDEEIVQMAAFLDQHKGLHVLDKDEPQAESERAVLMAQYNEPQEPTTAQSVFAGVYPARVCMASPLEDLENKSEV